MSVLFRHKVNWKYALGEVILIFIGITLALTFNNWNERRKDRAKEQETFHNLLTALRQDSSELELIVRLKDESVGTQFKVINSEYAQLIQPLKEEEVGRLITRILNGNFSFFPKYGTYNAIHSTTGLDIIESAEIKSKLIDLYDYKYKRYESIRPVVNEKYGFGMEPFLQNDLGLFVDGYDQITGVNKDQFRESYSHLKNECKNTYSWVKHSRNVLVEIQISVDQLIEMIDAQIQTP